MKGEYTGHRLVIVTQGGYIGHMLVIVTKNGQGLVTGGKEDILVIVWSSILT